jgi:hypothetical protein
VFTNDNLGHRMIPEQPSTEVFFSGHHFVGEALIVCKFSN